MYNLLFSFFFFFGTQKRVAQCASITTVELIECERICVTATVVVVVVIVVAAAVTAKKEATYLLNICFLP